MQKIVQILNMLGVLAIPSIIWNIFLYKQNKKYKDLNARRNIKKLNTQKEIIELEFENKNKKLIEDYKNNVFNYGDIRSEQEGALCKKIQLLNEEKYYVLNGVDADIDYYENIIGLDQNIPLVNYLHGHSIFKENFKETLREKITRKIIELKSQENILILILIIAFFLRVFQLSYGYPLYFVSDETPNILASLKMIGAYSLRAATPGYYYPALTSYILLPFLGTFLFFGWFLGFFTSVTHIKEIVFLNFGIFMPAARMMSVVFGVLTVYLVYKICLELFKNKPPHKHISVNDINNKQQNELLIRHSKTVLSKNFLCEGKTIGLLSAWFLTISFMHVYNSHFAQTWVLQTFLIFLTMYLSVKFYNKNNLKIKNYVLSGLALGAAFGINSVGIFSYFFIALTHFLKNRHQGFVKIFVKNKKFLILNLTLFLTIIFVYYLNPYGLQNHFDRITDIKTPAEFGGAGYSSYKPLSPVFFQVLWFYIKVIFSQEIIFTVLGIFGAFYVWFKNRTAFYFIVPWIVIYFIIISPLTGATGRYILPVIPSLIILSAYFIHGVLKDFSYKIYISVIFLISLLPLTSSVLFNLRLMKEETQVLAYNWVLINVPIGSKIQNEHLGESFPFVENKETIVKIQDLRPELMSTKRKYLLSLSDDKYPRPNFLISDYKELSEKIANFDYIILGHYKKQSLEDQKKSLPKNVELIKYFYPVGSPNSNINFPSRHFPPTDDLNYSPFYLLQKAEHNGPYVEIYKIINKN